MTAKEFLEAKFNSPIDFDLTVKEIKGTTILEWMEEYFELRTKSEKISTKTDFKNLTR